jgi:hypothetical protein
MARLNEPPISGESVEARMLNPFRLLNVANSSVVKRRFLRQNRELAK